MGRLRGVRKEHIRSIRDWRATKQPTHFQRHPPGRGQLAVFPRCSLDPYDTDMGTSLAPWKTANWPAARLKGF